MQSTAVAELLEALVEPRSTIGSREHLHAWHGFRPDGWEDSIAAAVERWHLHFSKGTAATIVEEFAIATS